MGKGMYTKRSLHSKGTKIKQTNPPRKRKAKFGAPHSNSRKPGRPKKNTGSEIESSFLPSNTRSLRKHKLSDAVKNITPLGITTTRKAGRMPVCDL